MDLAGLGSGPTRVCVRSDTSVCGRAAPRHRRGRSVGVGRARAGGRQGVVRRHRADEREERHDRDCRRLLRHRRASRLDLGCKGGSSRRRDSTRHDRSERNARAGRALRAPRDSHCGRSGGVRRSAHAPATADGSSASDGRGRASASTAGARSSCGGCSAGALALAEPSRRGRSDSSDRPSRELVAGTALEHAAGLRRTSARCFVDSHSVGARRWEADCALSGGGELEGSPGPGRAHAIALSCARPQGESSIGADRGPTGPPRRTGDRPHSAPHR